MCGWIWTRSSQPGTRRAKGGSGQLPGPGQIMEQLSVQAWPTTRTGRSPAVCSVNISRSLRSRRP
jgi:hypothetical protein